MQEGREKAGIRRTCSWYSAAATSWAIAARSILAVFSRSRALPTSFGSYWTLREVSRACV